MRAKGPNQGRRKGELPAISTETADPKAETATIAVAAGAKLLRVEPGLYTLAIAPGWGEPGSIEGVSLPAAQVTATFAADEEPVEVVAAQRAGSWIGVDGGSVVLRSPARGGHVLVTSYALPGQIVRPLDVALYPIGSGPPPPAIVPTAVARPSLRCDIVLHIEREGDRRFSAGGWAGRLGSRLRIEALAVRPLEAIPDQAIEYKAFTRGGRETPWVRGGQFCGTRGQSLPLTGFAIRLAPELRDRFDVVYQGAFFNSGTLPPVQNGEVCMAPFPDDPLEAVNIRFAERRTPQR